MGQNQISFILPIVSSKNYDEAFGKMTEIYDDSIKLLNASGVCCKNLTAIDETLNISASCDNFDEVITSVAKIKAMNDYHRNTSNGEMFFSFSECFSFIKMTRTNRKVKCRLLKMEVCGELSSQDLSKIEEEKIHLTRHIRFYKDRFVIFAYGVGDLEEC